MTGNFGENFAIAIQFFAAAQCAITESIIPSYDVKDKEQFDFIIVGGGSAGCVLANRLSEVKDWRILLIEAGGDPPLEANVPGYDDSLYKTKYDWQYLTENDGRTNEGNIGGSIYWFRGKMLGGSSNMNKMVYVHGNDHDFQTWYDAGNPKWSVDAVRRCFKKAESFQNENALKNPDVYKHYGHNGPLVVNNFNSTYRDLTDKILSAYQEIGINNVPDINVAKSFGSGVTAVTAANGERQSTHKAYLNPAKARSNLKIIKNSLVTKVLVNQKTKVAYGVEVENNVGKYKILASKEVILSAGAIGSPQILMISGIGPKEQLTSVNISVICDSPNVGQNIQDHLMIHIPILGNKPDEMNVADLNFDTIKYLYNRTGYYAQNGAADIITFFSSNKNISYPEYQTHHFISWKKSKGLRHNLVNNFRYIDSIADWYENSNSKNAIYIIGLNLLHPKSKGNITLKSNNPREHPKIYPNYFINPEDLKSTAIGIKMVTKIVDTFYFRSIGAFVSKIDYPPCDEFEFESIEYWECFSASTVTTVSHPVGSCRMGPDVTTSVVDSRLRVHGIKNLRVIDASVMPEITSGNINGPSIMVGERGAELVKEDHGV